MEEELDKRRNCEDSDDGDNARDFDNTMKEVEMERPSVFLGENWIDKSDKGEINSVLINVGDTMDSDEVMLPKSSYGWV